MQRWLRFNFVDPESDATAETQDARTDVLPLAEALERVKDSSEPDRRRRPMARLRRLTLWGAASVFLIVALAYVLRERLLKSLGDLQRESQGILDR